MSYGRFATGRPDIIILFLKSKDKLKNGLVKLESGFLIFVDSSSIVATFLVFKKSFKFPLIHPPKIITNKIYDKLCEDKIFSKSLKNRLVWLLKFFNFN